MYFFIWLSFFVLFCVVLLLINCLCVWQVTILHPFSLNGIFVFIYIICVVVVVVLQRF